MANTVQEKQDLIDAKDWDGLVLTNIFSDFDRDTATFEQYTFDRDFVLSFVFNEDRFTEHSAHIFASTGKDIFPYFVLFNVMKRVRELGIKFSTAEWKVIIGTVCDLIEVRSINSATANDIVAITGKDAAFLRALADDDLYDRVLDIKMSGLNAYRLDAEEFAKLTPQEQEKVALRLTYGQRTRVYIDKGDMRIFASAVKSPQDLNRLAYLIATDVGKILADLEPGEYLNTLFELLDKQVKVGVDYWLPYFLDHQDYELSETQFKKLSDHFDTDMYRYIIGNLTDKMIMNNIKSIDIEILIKRDSLTLDKIAEFLGPRSANLCGAPRFFTDEEIAQHPNFFDPDFLRHKPWFYVSRDTFKILNKSWGTKYRYNEDLTDFSAITAALAPAATNIKTLRYLKEKTNASNEVVVKAIGQKHVDEAWSKDAKKLAIIKNFITKFSQ